MLDCIIIGTGPAGLSAAINLKTYNKDFIWFGSKKLSDKLNKAEKIVNYPGFPEISGEELGERFNEHILRAGLSIDEKMVTSVMNAGDYYMVLADNEVYEAKTIILAVGVMTARPLEGEDEFLGRGVSYCATCDGNLYKGKKLAVFCNTPNHESEVSFLASIAEKIYYFPTFKSELSGENIEISNDFPVKISGDFKVKNVLQRSGAILDVDGVFLLRNALAPASLVPGIKVEDGHIVVGRRMETNLEGLFACGDCTGRPYQFTKAVGEGNVAAHAVIEYLK